MSDKIKYCPLCGNTGKRLDGSPCTCRMHRDELYAGVECLEIPEAYRGLKFNELMLPNVLGTAYKGYMRSLHEQIISLRWKCKNALVCSPQQSGKSVLAYSAIQELFRKEIRVFPLYDVLEIRRIMLDIEYNKNKSMGCDNPLDLYEVPYLFAVIPPMTIYDTYDAAAMLVARRVRRGNSTILFYGGTWNQLVFNDSKGSLKNMKGNGSLTTLEVTSWGEPKEEN